MKSKVLGSVVGLMVAAALAGCGGGGGGDPAATTGSATTPSGNQQPTGTTPPVVTAPVQYTLASTVSGSGTVTITPASAAGIVCSTATCSNAFDTGTSLTLTAAPASGYTFSGWTGGTCTGTAACTIALNSDKAATATFVTVPKVTVTVATSGSGSVGGTNVACSSGSGTCSTSIDQNSQLTLTATPASGYAFTGWAGSSGCSTTTSCTVTADVAKTVTATFSVQVVAGTCNIQRSATTSPTYATGHPKVFVNHTPTLSCLQQLLAYVPTPSTTVTPAKRFLAIVDDEKASASNTTYYWKNPKNYLFQSWQAALMYKVKGDASYGTFAVQRIDKLVADEEALIATNNVPYVARDSFLDIGQWIGDVALVYDWCYDLLTPTQRTRWLNYMNQSVYNVWNQASARWGGTWNGTAWTGGFASPGNGWAANDPYNNYYYSFLRATMLLGLATNGDDARATTWINQFRTTKLGNQLLTNFNANLAGGGSLEGTGYGTAMKSLFQLYDWWERSTGERVATLTPHTLSSMAWMMHNITPKVDFLAAVGDQARDSSAAMFDYHREYLLNLISLFPQDRLSSVSKVLLDGSPSETKMQNSFEAFLDYLYQPPTLPSASITDMSTAYWASGPGNLMMRSAWGDTTAAFSQFTCGPYVQSHAHHEQGAFQIYRGAWLASSGNTFTSSGIQQNEDFHNLVRINDPSGNPIRQVYNSPRCDLNALADNANYTYAMADVTPVYNGNAAVQKVEREYLFVKPSTFVVFDRVKSASGTSRIWTLNVSDAPTISGDHLTMAARKARVFYNATSLTYARDLTGSQMDVYRLAPTGLSYTSNTPNYGQYDSVRYGEEPRRIDVTDTAGTQTNFLHVISTSTTGASGAISNVTRSDATGQTGVQFTTADNKVVTVRFNNATSASKAANGGTVDIRTTTGTVLVNSQALPTTVVAPPVFKN